MVDLWGALIIKVDEDVHVFGANYLPKTISHQSQLLSVEEPPSNLVSWARRSQGGKMSRH